MKFLDALRIANQNLWQNKARSFLTILAIFVGSFAIILNTAISAGVNDFIDREVASIGGDNFIEVMPSSIYNQMMSSQSSSKVREYSESTATTTLSTVDISDDDLAALRAVDGVESLDIYHNLSTEWLRLAGAEKKYSVSVEYLPSDTLNVDLSAGQNLDENSSDYEILINEDWLEPLGFSSAEAALGKTVDLGFKQTAKCAVSDDCIYTVSAKIVGVEAPGIFTTTGALHVNKSLSDEIYAKSIENLPPSAVTNYMLTGKIDTEKLDSIREAFKNVGAGYELITISDLVGTVRSFLNVILFVLNIFGAIALIAAAIGIINTLLMSVEERTREIGLEKALGMSEPRIFLEFSLEAIFLGFWGSLLGVAVAYLLGTTANSILHEPGQVLANFPTFTLAEFSPSVTIPIILVVMLIAFLAGTIPALKAAKKNPIDALRYE